MSSPKSVIIALSKGSSPKTIQVNELTRGGLSRLNFSTSIMTDGKTRMDARKVLQVSPKQEEIRPDEDFATFITNTDGCTRSKKRRLDHLTWEEKMQRKKLKNRVAAQTSRDRKKAKLDELEETVKTLKDRNEQLEQECRLLRSQNESLVSESRRLRRERDMRNETEDQQQQQYCSECQTRVGCAGPLPGSAAGWTSTAGIVPDANPKSNRSVEDSMSLPSLEELLFTDEKCVERLEELVASLMQEANIGGEAKSHRTDEQLYIAEDPLKKSDCSKTMVGQASEDVEADRVCESLSAVSYLPDTSDWHSVIRDTTESTAPIKTKIEIKQESEPAPDLDTVYGTYNEATNSITIIYPGEESDGCVGIQECVQEVISTETDVATHLTVPPLSTTRLGYPAQFSPAYTDTMSPAMSDVHSDADSCGISSTKLDYANLSDGGYESHDSPDPRLSNNALADPWHESFTELFPMLA